MKKIFTFLFAALMSVSMFGATVTEDISMNASDWGWGYNSQVVASGDMLQCTLTGEWGAMSTGWDPTRDLSEWDKVVIVVENMSGCEGQWFKLKAYLRDNTESEANQMEGQLDLEAADNAQHYMVIDLHQDKACDLTQAKILAIQCQPNGAVFKISRVYLEKEAEAQPGGEAEYAEIIFTEPVVADSLAENAVFEAEGSLFSATIYDSGNKMSIDANSCRFGTAEDYKSYSHRLKSGGASSPTKNYIMLNIPEDGVIRIAPRTGSNGATDRVLVIEQGNDTLYNAIVQESQAVEVTEGEQQVKVYPYVEVAVAAGSVRVSYTAGSMNFYGFGYAKESVAPVVPTAPTTAPAVPDHAEEDVMALYCSHYATNNLHFNVLGWGGIQTWQELTLGEDSTKVLACTDMTWDMMTCWDTTHYDLSAYDKFHCDLWVPFASVMKVTFEAKSGWKNGVEFRLNEGWNTIDCDPVWWNTDSVTYDWKDVKYIAFEGYKMADGETSAEGNPFAFTNLYWWKAAAPANIPAEAPATPKLAEKDVQALFCSAYQTNTFNFAPTSWGTQWIDHEYQGGIHIWYADAMAWDGFTNWDTTRYDLNAFDMMHADVYVTLDSKLKFTFEALGAGDGGSGWKNGASVDLVGNQWNSLDIDLLNAPFDSYDFKDLRYMILEGFQKPDGSSAEGTPLAIANVYFWNSMTPVENVANDKVAVKRIVNGQLMIQVNGQEYNVLGTQF